MNFLLDTCVLSEFTKPKPNHSLMQWMKSHPDSSYYISVITLGELKRGIEQLGKSKKRTELEKWFEKELIPRFDSRMIPIDASVALEWGKLLAENTRKGKSLPSIDSLLAASARTYRLTLVTRNLKDFETTDVLLANPWE